MRIGSLVRRSLGALALSSALALPPAAGAEEPLRLAQANSCTDAKAHFDVAREIGTREALQLHVDLFPNCPFAPLAKLLIAKLPGGDAPTPQSDKPQVEKKDAADPAAAEGRRYAQALADRLASWDIPPREAVTASFEEARIDGNTVTVKGFTLLSPVLRGGAIEQYRLRFDTAVMERPSLSSDGSLAVDKLTLTNGQSGEKPRGGADFVPAALNLPPAQRGNQVSVGTVTFTKAEFPAAREPDALGMRVKAEEIALDRLGVKQNDKEMFVMSGFSLKPKDMKDGVPTNVALAIDDIAVDAVAALGATEAQIFVDLGLAQPHFTVAGTVLAFDSDKSISLFGGKLGLKDGMEISAQGKILGLGASELVQQLGRGRFPPDSFLAKISVAPGYSFVSDRGLRKRVITYIAAKSGVDETLLKQLAVVQMRAQIADATRDPALATKLADLLTPLVNDQGYMKLEVSPEAPVPLREIAMALQGPQGLKPILERLGAAISVNGGGDVQLASLVTGAARRSELTPEQSQALTTCNTLAADSDDPEKPEGVAGVKSMSDIDAAKAVPACETALAAMTDDPQTTFHLGRAYRAAGRDADAVAKFKAAAAGGQPVATYEYASALLYGVGVEADPQAAAVEVKKVVDRLPYARSLMGYMTYHGEGVTADVPAAIALWQAGADKNEAPSLYYLGVEYINGTAVPADYKKAETYLTSAADQGETEAGAELGKLYYRGSLGQPDYPRAFAALSKAADAGSLIGLANRGYMQALGVGTAKNNAAGANDLLKALAGGDPDARGYLINDKGTNFDADFRKIVQRKLRLAGVYDGPLNGVFGDRTIAAMEKYKP